MGGVIFTLIPNPYDVGEIGGYVAAASGVYFSFRILEGDESVVYTYPDALRIYTIDLLEIIFPSFQTSWSFSSAERMLAQSVWRKNARVIINGSGVSYIAPV